MIDLHSHSTASDGRLTPSDLIARAAAFGVTILALTDHDTIDGLTAARRATAEHDLAFVNGVEISVSWQRRTLHIVGLAFDPEADTLKAGLAGLQHTRYERARLIGERLRRVGLENGLDRAVALAGTGQLTRPHFARLLVEDGLCRDTNDAFKRYLRPGKPGYAAIEWTSLEASIRWIREAGGIAVLAHPFGYGFSGAWRRRAIAAFATAGGQALEICTGRSNPDQESQAAHDAREHGLYGSLGSDFHGPEQFWLALGRLHTLPRSVQPVWEHENWSLAG